MRKGLVFFLVAMLLAGCGQATEKEMKSDVQQTENLSPSQKEELADSSTSSQESEEKNMSLDENKESVEIQIKEFLMQHLAFRSEDAVMGTAQKLSDAGCKTPVELLLTEDSDDVYVVQLKDQNNNVFLFNVSHDGYVGPIQDDQGNYLYAPID